MDLIQMLRAKVNSLEDGDYILGLKSVLIHMDAARRHWDRGQNTGDDTAYTDTIYRTNQVFEGSIKEAYRVIANLSPEKLRPFDIENYLTSNSLFRPRVLNQFKNYRQEWRNPSAHDYQLDFDASESFLAIVSVAAFGCVLLDQMIEKIAFDKAKSQLSEYPSDSNLITNTIKDAFIDDLISEIIVGFCNDKAAYPDKNHNEAQLVGALHAYIVTNYPEMNVQIEPLLSDGSRVRCDMMVSSKGEKIIIEVKRSVKYQYNESILSQIARYMDHSGIKKAILFLGPREIQPMKINEHREILNDGILKIIFPENFANDAEIFPKEFM